MTAAPPPAVADRFALIIDGLCRAMAASRTGGLMAPLIMLLWNRLRRTATRFARIAAHVQAGTLPSRARPRTRHCEKRSDEAIQGDTRRRSSRRRSPRLPRAFGWLIRLIPGVACARSQLQHLLSDPEIAKLLTAAPQLGRLLRPLCHMLAIGPSPDVPRTLMLSSPRRPPGRQRHCANTQTPANPAPFNTLARPHPPPEPWQPLFIPLLTRS